MISNLALCLWPLVSIGLFAGFGCKRGLVLSVVLGYLFLPSSFEIDLPALPPYSRVTAISFGVLFGYLIYKGRMRDDSNERVSRNRFLGGLLTMLFLIYALSPIMTYLTNRETLVFGGTVLPGLKLWDTMGLIWRAFIAFIPFYVSRRTLVTEEDQLMLLRTLVVAGFCYTFLVVFEARMSPQLHVWVYGFFPHDWLQHIRGGAYRPVVFLGHGLEIGLLLLMVSLGAVTLTRTGDPKRRMTFLLLSVWVLAGLLISRNLGATMLTLLFAPVVLFLGTWVQVRVAVVVALIFLLYPVVRQTGILPMESFANWIQSISPERAASFQYRLENEQALLARALEKPLFGWGGYGRSRIFNEWGQDISTTDGLWIIVLGTSGWIGYIAFFGLIIAPVVWLRSVAKRKSVPPVTAGIAIILAANFMYIVPNATFSPIGVLLAGTLAAFVEFDTASRNEAAVGPDKRQQAIRYTRFNRSRT